MNRKNEYFGDYNKPTKLATFFNSYIIYDSTSSEDTIACLSTILGIDISASIHNSNLRDMGELVGSAEQLFDKEITYCNCKELFKEDTIVHFLKLLRNSRVAINTLYSGQSWQIVVGYIGHGSYDEDMLVLYDVQTKEINERHLTEVLDMWIDWEMIYSPIK